MNTSLLCLITLISFSFLQGLERKRQRTYDQKQLSYVSLKKKNKGYDVLFKKREYQKLKFDHSASKNGRKYHYYICQQCNNKSEMLLSNLKVHLHNPCLPEDGIDCMHCLVRQEPHNKFQKLGEIVEHNIEKHSDLKYWRCGVCEATVKVEEFYTHFSNLSHNGIGKKLCSGLTREQFNILIGSMQKAEQTGNITNSTNSQIAVIPPLSEWKWFKPTGSNTKKPIQPGDPIINKYPEIFN